MHKHLLPNLLTFHNFTNNGVPWGIFNSQSESVRGILHITAFLWEIRL